MSSNMIVTFILSYFKLVFFIVNLYSFILSLFTSSSSKMIFYMNSKMIFYMNPFCHIMTTALPLLKGLSFDGFPRTIG